MRRLLPLLLLAGCTVGPDFERPSPWSPASWFRTSASTSAPAPAAASLPVAEPIDPDWWAVFDDPVLTGLMRRAAAANLDVRAAGLRLAQARAQRGIAAADLFPRVNGNGSYTRQRVSSNGAINAFGSSLAGDAGGLGNAATGTATGAAAAANGAGGTAAGFPASGGIPSFDLFQGGFDATWELDLWGRVRRAVESADANVDASAEARRQLLVTALAELARSYLQLRGTQDQIRITRDNLAIARENAYVTVQRTRAGLATDLDVANASAQAEGTAASLPQLEAQAAQLTNAAAMLLGAPPGALAAELSPPRPVPPVPPRVPVGLPSELTRRRPDVREAEARLHAATADIGQAEADFFPRITLSGSFALQATQFKDLGSWASRTYAIGPSLSIPVFEGGRLTRTLQLRRAQQQEAAINYQKVVLTAFHDVDDALTAYGAEQGRRDRLRVQQAEARRALGLAQSRFRQGLSDFLEVLNAQRQLLGAEQQLSDSTTAVATRLVALYKALGGGWETAPGPAP